MRGIKFVKMYVIIVLLWIKIHSLSASFLFMKEDYVSWNVRIHKNGSCYINDAYSVSAISQLRKIHTKERPAADDMICCARSAV